ncbi:MAG: hypothetical protein IPH35_02435 [Rhodoferax sp.]|nr:hypothetical protein [Rhodoferax sp.]
MARNNVLASCLPGRIRLRHPALREGRCNARLQAALHTLDGALIVEPNVTVGSLLFHYDLTRCDQRTMESQVAILCGRVLGEPATASDLPDEAKMATAPVVERRRSTPRQFNRVAKVAMLASFPLSLALAALGKKNLHAVTGGVFTLFLLVHLGVHRRNLIK